MILSNITWLFDEASAQSVGMDLPLCDEGNALADIEGPFACDSPPTIFYPIHEIDALIQRHKRLSYEGAFFERPPVACGTVRRIQLLGVFPTTRWLADSTMHPDVKEMFGGTPFFALGCYQVAHVDLLDGCGTVHFLTLIVNKGVEGLSTGYWGAIFERNSPNECWARFKSIGEKTTTVKAETLASSRFVEFGCVDFNEDYFQGEKVPGICSQQVERVIGLTVEFILAVEWSNYLPEDLIVLRDTSCRLERKRLARFQKYLGEDRRVVCTPTKQAPDENIAPRKLVRCTKADATLSIEAKASLPLSILERTEKPLRVISDRAIT